MPRHLIIKLLKPKDKDKILYDDKDRWCITYGEQRKMMIWMTVDFSWGIVKEEGNETVFFKALKEKNPQPRILYPVKIPSWMKVK